MIRISIPQKYRSLVQESSREFIELIRQYKSAHPGDLALIRKALAAFAIDHPPWYSQWVFRAVDIEPMGAAALTIREADLHRNIEQFSERLVIHPFKTFILNEARIFLSGSSVMDEDYYIFRLSQNSLGSEQNYYSLFQIVNRAVLQAGWDWEQFRRIYHQEFLALLKRNAGLRTLALSIGEEARLLMKQQNATKIIDTGPQGSFALFLSEALRLRAHTVETDVMLFSVYPWLAELFDGRYQTKDASYTCIIEKNLARMQRNMDPLEKASGTVVGFAVGDALGAPAVGILKEDFLRLKGSEIHHFTTNPAHPYFYHLAAGQTTDLTRMLVGVAEDLASHRCWQRSSRISSLIQWASHCQHDPGFARWPGTVTFHAAIQLGRGREGQHAVRSHINSWGAVPRSIALGLVYRQEEELLRVSRQETMLTHNSWESISATVYVALLINYLIEDFNPYSAAEKALRGVMDEYGRHVPAAFARAVKLAIQTPIEPHEALRVFGTGTPTEECIPLAVYYFLRYPSHFRTPVQLATNSYRMDSAQEQRRLRSYNWREQVLYCHGGNTGGIAAMVGAFVGAHNGLKIIDEQFVVVEDFDHLVRLGRQLETLRLKRRCPPSSC